MSVRKRGCWIEVVGGRGRMVRDWRWWVRGGEREEEEEGEVGLERVWRKG